MAGCLFGCLQRKQGAYVHGNSNHGRRITTIAFKGAAGVGGASLAGIRVMTLTKPSAGKLSLFLSIAPNGNVSLPFRGRGCRKIQNSNVAVDKSILRSERTNQRFHHLAHHQLFPMNYLLAALHLACPLLLMW